MQIVRDSVCGALGKELTEKEWRRLIHDGYVPDSVTLSLPYPWENRAQRGERGPKPDAYAGTSNPSPLVPRDPPGGRVEGGELELVFTASDTTYDGRFANNGWLQETPDSLTKVTWDNAAVISPKTAKELGIEHATLVDVTGQPRQHAHSTTPRTDAAGS